MQHTRVVLQGEAVQDWREIVTYFSYPVKARDYSRWPDKPVAWRAVVERYSEQLMGLACKLLGVLSEAMGLETDALAKACVDMDQKVVVNFYPRCRSRTSCWGSSERPTPAPSRCCCRTSSAASRPRATAAGPGSPCSPSRAPSSSTSATTAT